MTKPPAQEGRTGGRWNASWNNANDIDHLLTGRQAFGRLQGVKPMYPTEDGFAWPGGMITGHNFALQGALAACPYRTIIAKRLPAKITSIWYPRQGDPLPIPGVLLRDMTAKFYRSEAILLIASDSSVRDRAKVALVALLSEKGERV